MCDWPRFTVRGAIFLSVDHGLAAGTQQDYFAFVSDTAAGRAPATPTFENLSKLVHSFRVDSLSALPAPWYDLIDAPVNGRAKREKRGPAEVKPTPRTNAGARSVMNPYADEKLVKGFKASGHKNIRDVVKGHNVDAPKQGGKETCMSWACKGACNAACKRVGMHVRYTRETITTYHGLMDTCGVAANPQE